MTVQDPIPPSHFRWIRGSVPPFGRSSVCIMPLSPAKSVMCSATKAYGLSLAIIIISLLSLTEADSAACESGWEWSYNSEGQNPCDITGFLQSSCLGNSTYVLAPLASGDVYPAPKADDEKGKECDCNTVTYSLYMACTACQNRTFQTWPDWVRKCDGVNVTQYPFDIPLGTTVPHWAYLNYTDGGQFDPDLAKAAGRDPEATPKLPPTVSLSSSTPPTSSPSSPGVNKSGSKTNVGAIAGGVVGGVIALAAFGVLAFTFLKRRRGRQVGASRLGSGREGYGTEANVQEFKQQRMYNSSDPSTYPDSRVEDDYFGGNVTTPLHRPGRYTGAAEL